MMKGATPAESTAENAETAESLNRITEIVIGAAMRVHQALGPGLLESAYDACLAFELIDRGMKVIQQQPLPVVYRDVRLNCGYRLDLVVENRVVVEVESVARLDPIHDAQLISYLRLSSYRVGLLINFNVKVLKNGIRRLVNNFPKFSAVSALSAVNSSTLLRVQPPEQEEHAAEVKQPEEVLGLVLPACREPAPSFEPSEEALDFPPPLVTP
jgi:GxxExxY protein